MIHSKTAKVTISLREELLKLADRLAKEWATSRSGVFAELLEKEQQAQLEALMEEGYREMAEESLRFAKETFPVGAKVVLRNTEWEDDARDSTR